MSGGLPLAFGSCHLVLATCHLVSLGIVRRLWQHRKSEPAIGGHLYGLSSHFKLYVFLARFVVFSQSERITGHTFWASTTASWLEKATLLSQDSMFWVFSFVSA